MLQTSKFFNNKHDDQDFWPDSIFWCLINCQLGIMSDLLTRKSNNLCSEGIKNERVFDQNQVVINANILVLLYATDSFLVDVDNSNLSEWTEVEKVEINILLFKQ